MLQLPPSKVESCSHLSTAVVKSPCVQLVPVLHLPLHHRGTPCNLLSSDLKLEEHHSLCTDARRSTPNEAMLCIRRFRISAASPAQALGASGSFPVACSSRTFSGTWDVLALAAFEAWILSQEYQKMPASAIRMPPSFLAGMVSSNTRTPPAMMMMVLECPSTLHMHGCHQPACLCQIAASSKQQQQLAIQSASGTIRPPAACCTLGRGSLLSEAT